MKPKFIVALAVIGVALSAAAAHAADVRASGGSAIYTGPALEFPQIGHLTDGQRYKVNKCTSDISWCEVIGDGATVGWVLADVIVGSPAKLEARQWGLDAKEFWNPFR